MLASRAFIGSLITGAVLLLVYALVKAPAKGGAPPSRSWNWAGTAVLLVLFVALESRIKKPLPPTIFRIPGLAAAEITQVIGVGGFNTMFFFLTLYTQNVLGYSPIKTGLAYVPLTLGVGVSSGIASGLIGRVGTKPIIIAGALVTGAGLFLLSGIPDDGSYLPDLLPGLLVVSLGIGGVLVGTTTAANAGVPRPSPG